MKKIVLIIFSAAALGGCVTPSQYNLLREQNKKCEQANTELNSINQLLMHGGDSGLDKCEWAPK